MTGRTVRVKITPKDPIMGKPWYASSWCTMTSVKRHLQRLNEYAAKRRLAVTYEETTEEEYQAYRAQLRKEIGDA